MPPRRLWCSCTIIDYLKGTDRAKPCLEIIEHAEHGEIEIAVSMLAHAEVAKMGPTVATADEARIREFLGRPYVVSFEVNRAVAAEARRLMQAGLMHKPLDAVHAATAILYRIPVLETYDLDDFMPVNGAGDPALTVRHPIWDGQTSLSADLTSPL